MAEINAAYDLLRAGDWQRRREGAHGRPRRHQGRRTPTRPHAAGRRGRGCRPRSGRALGGELLRALEPDEAVVLVTPAATWASPQTLLALTDRRLLWLLDDAPTDRVRSARLSLVVAVEHRLRRPLRRVATVRVHLRDRRRLEFTELRPATAAALARRLGATLDAA